MHINFSSMHEKRPLGADRVPCTGRAAELSTVGSGAGDSFPGG